MLEHATLKNFHPVFVTPSHDGKFYHNYFLSVIRLIHTMTQQQLPFEILTNTNESLVTRARNNCVAQFLANPNWTHLFWVDADIGFSVEAAFRLLLSDYDVCAGIYPFKAERWPDGALPAGLTAETVKTLYTRYPVNSSSTHPQAEQNTALNIVIQPDGFFEAREAPTGFMCIKRAVIERMRAAYPELRYVPDDYKMQDSGLHYRLFDVMVDPNTGRYLSEDYAFCRLWEKLGGRIFLDAHSALTHQGSKLYEGNFSQSLRANLAYAIGAPVGIKMTMTGMDFLAK